MLETRPYNEETEDFPQCPYELSRFVQCSELLLVDGDDIFFPYWLQQACARITLNAHSNQNGP